MTTTQVLRFSGSGGEAVRVVVVVVKVDGGGFKVSQIFATAADLGFFF